MSIFKKLFKKRESVIVYGPPGCGKTWHSEIISCYLKLDNVVDGWSPSDPLPKYNCLALTNVPPPYSEHPLRAEPFDALMGTIRKEYGKKKNQ